MFVEIPSPLSGNYTINDGLPTTFPSGNNFNSFSDVAQVSYNFV